MKLVNTVRLTGALVAGVLLSLFSANSFALTAAGTSINNVAIAGYSVGGISQDSICSSPTGNSTNTGSTSTSTALCTGGGGAAGTFTTFVVDDKLILTVTTTDVADVSVTPGQTSAVLTFQVTNNGNAPQGVSFSTVQEVTGTVDPFVGTEHDDFDPTAIQVFVHKNGTGYGVGAYSAANDVVSAIGQLAAGASASVYIVSTIPASQVDADVAVEALVAQVAIAGADGNYATVPGANITTDDTGNAWTPGAQQKIFADAAGTDDSAKDGKDSSRDAYLVKSAKLTVSKTQQVVSDPVAGTCLTGGTSNGVNNGKGHAIPGAVIGYTITVTNAVAATTSATSVSIADAIPANTTYVAGSISVADPNIAGTIPSAGAGNPNACVDGGSTFTTGAFTATCSFAAATANASINTLQHGETFTVFFEATVN